MEIKKEKIILLLLFVLAFGFRLLFLFRVNFFSSDEAYFNLRHTKYIVENFFPLLFDPQSYGGNIILNTHVFHYFLALFDWVLPDAIVYKIVPCLLASSIVIIVYFLAKKITNNEYAALFGALLSAFIPSYIGATLNQISLTSLFIPVFLLTLYFFIEIRQKKTGFLILGVILVLLDPLNLLMLFSFLFFALLMFAESLHVERDEKEAIGMFIVFFLLANLILFKQLYLEQSLAAVWQNLPLELYGSLFQNFDLLGTITLIGIVPLVLGITGFMIYREKNRVITLFSAILMADFTLLLLRLIPFEEGVLFLAIILCITASFTMDQLTQYIRLTKMARYERLILGGLLIGTVISLVIPSTSIATDVIHSGVQAEEIEALHWIKFNTPRASVVVGNAYEGNLIIAIADRTNVIDTQFFHADNRILDVETIFTTESLIKAKRALDQYGVDYIYFSQKTQELYGVEELIYTRDEACFEEVFKNEFATIYQVVC